MNRFKELLARISGMDPALRLRWGGGIAALLLVLILFSAANQGIHRLEQKRRAREADLTEMLKLKSRYQSLATGGQSVVSRLAAVRPDDSPARIVEETGIKGKGLQVKPLKSEEVGGFTADLADVNIDGVTANEAVNLLYRIEAGSRPVVIRKALIKTRFDDPSRLDLKLTIALLKGASQGKR